MKLSTTWSKLKSPEFLAKLKADDILNMSSSLAFYGVLSLAPILILTLAIYSILGENSRELLINQIHTLAGEQAAAALRSISLSAQANVNLRDTAGMIGGGSLLMSAGAIFGHLRSAFNKIFEVTPPRGQTRSDSAQKSDGRRHQQTVQPFYGPAFRSHCTDFCGAFFRDFKASARAPDLLGACGEHSGITLRLRPDVFSPLLFSAPNQNSPPGRRPVRSADRRLIHCG